jgi:hypothetical protein
VIDPSGRLLIELEQNVAAMLPPRAAQCTRWRPFQPEARQYGAAKNDVNKSHNDVRYRKNLIIIALLSDFPVDRNGFPSYPAGTRGGSAPLSAWFGVVIQGERAWL